MKQTISKKKKYFVYILYGIILTVGLLYYCFPSDAFRNHIQASASRKNPQLLLSVGNARLSFPFGLKLLQTELSKKINPDMRLFMADSLLIRPEIWSFLRGNFNCRAYDGDLMGHIHFLEDGLPPSFSVSIKLKDICIDHYAPLAALIGRNAKGILCGTVTYSGQDNLLKKGAGEANLRISEGSVNLLQPFLQLESIDFDELRAKLVFKNQKIDVSHVKLEGREIQGTLSGTIRLRKEFLKSGLDLKGTIELLPAAFLNGENGALDTEMFSEQALESPFTISGTIAKPRFKFI